MKKEQFSKDHTYITKGILIILMFMHHLFTYEWIEIFSVSVTLPNVDLFCYICAWAKICISGFAFLTAFGMTYSFREIEKNDDYFKHVCKRLLRLWADIFVVFALVVIYKRFVIVQSIRALYDSGEGFNILYLIIDMFGLADFFGTPTMNSSWWYLSYAICLIVTMPFIYIAYKKFGKLLLPVGCLIGFVVFRGNEEFCELLPSVLLGTAFAYENWFEKIEQSTRNILHRIIRICIEIVGIVMSFLFFKMVGMEYTYIWAFLIPLLVYEMIAYIPILNVVLKFIGRHATTLFLIHTFVCIYHYSAWIYSFKKDWLILLVLIAVCLVVAVIIELLKKVFRYNLLVERVSGRILYPEKLKNC